MFSDYAVAAEYKFLVFIGQDRPLVGVMKMASDKPAKYRNLTGLRDDMFVVVRSSVLEVFGNLLHLAMAEGKAIDREACRW